LVQKPEFWIDKLRAEPDSKTLSELAIRLGHELVSWTKDFANLGGIACLVNLLNEKFAAKKYD